MTGMRDGMSNRPGEAPAVLDARLRAVAGCLAAAGPKAASAALADSPGGDGWVLLSAGEATIACTVVEFSGVFDPVAIAIMTGPARTGPGPQAAKGQPRSQSRRQRGRATKHAH
jgi:hypothetical protein